MSIFTLYNVYGKEKKSDDIEEKTLAEVRYLEDTFIDLFNGLNNIKFENYTITASEIKNENSSTENNTEETTSSSKSSGETESKKGESGSSQQSGNSQNTESSKDNKEYYVEETGVLTNKSEINWENIKNESERIYTSLSKTTLDLYEIGVNQQEILNFNKEYDNLIKTVKEENKQETLTELSILYNYLPTFLESCTDNEKDNTVIKTKNYIFKAYSKLDNEDWQSISNDINQAIQEFTKIVTDVDTSNEKNKYNINKAYIMINELQNAINLNDKEIFLIKYKNLLEELENI
jgi:hypothetical protein